VQLEVYNLNSTRLSIVVSGVGASVLADLCLKPGAEEAQKNSSFLMQ
jgi:hypothetical protein